MVAALEEWVCFGQQRLPPVLTKATGIIRRRMLDERGYGVYVNQIISSHVDRSAVVCTGGADCLSGDANARSTAGGSGRSAGQPARTHPTTADANSTHGPT